MAPYAQAWVRGTFHVKNVGLYSGILVGSTALSRALASPYLGWLSDNVGRRLLIAVGLLCAGVLNLVGALSSNFWACVGLRFLAGLLNSTETVGFAAIGDLSTGNLRQVSFGYAKAASQIARILTSFIGGWTYNLKPDPLFENVPGYDTVLLSQLIAFGACLCGVLAIVLFYREGPEFTSVVRHEDEERQHEQQEEPTLYEVLSLRLKSSHQSRRSRSGHHEAEEEEPHHSFLRPPILPRGDNSFVGRPSLCQGVLYVLRDPLLVRLIVVYSLTSFLNGGLFLSINILALNSQGFDMQPKDSSVIMLLFGSWAIFFNALLFKPFVLWLGPKRANALGLLATGFGVLVLPFADHYVRAHTWLLWGCIAVGVLVFGSGYMLVNSLLLGFISAHASGEMQGITQGMAVFLSSICSGVGPIVLGIVANASQDARMPVLSFLFLTVGYTSAMAALHGVPRDVLEKQEE